MYKGADMTLWQGRADAEEGGERWHQKVTPLSMEGASPGVVLLGISCDAGVQRNLGRVGARGGPDAIRAALANCAWHLPVPCYDAGNVYCEGDDLESLQEEQAGWVARLLDLGHFPLLLGGGHEMSLGSNRGMERHLKHRGERAARGIVNFDAHFDLRSADRSTSGTPFREIAESRQEGTPFRYLCLGVSEGANTAALYRRAESLAVKWLPDEELTPWRVQGAEDAVREFVDGCGFIHLSIDLDVLPGSVAPGVSAPAALGVSQEVVEHLIGVLFRAAPGKVKVADIAEFNPQFDSDGRTARTAARLCYLIARGFSCGKGEGKEHHHE